MGLAACRDHLVIAWRRYRCASAVRCRCLVARKVVGSIFSLLQRADGKPLWTSHDVHVPCRA